MPPLLSKATQYEPYILWSPGIKSRKTDGFIPFYKKTNDTAPKTKEWGAPYIYGGLDSDGERLETSQAKYWLKYMLGHITQILQRQCTASRCYTATENILMHFIYVWLCWVFAVVCGDQGGGRLWLQGMGFSPCCLFSFPSAGSKALVGSVAAVPGLGCPVTCGVLPGQGSNPVSPALAGGFLSLDHRGSPPLKILTLPPTYWHFNHTSLV